MLQKEQQKSKLKQRTPVGLKGLYKKILIRYNNMCGWVYCVSKHKYKLVR